MAVAGRWTPTTKRVVLIVIVAAALFVVVRASEVVLPFVWAFVLGYVLLPAVAFLERRTRRRGLAAFIVFLALVASIAGVIRLVAPLAITQLRDVQHALPTLLQNAQITAASILRDLGMGDLDVLVFVPASPELSGTVARMLVPFATAIGRFALELLVFLIATFFVLRDAPRFFDLVRGLLPREHRAEILRIGEQVSDLIQRYIRGQLLLVAIMSTVTAIGLSILEVPYSIVLGLVTGVLELIPIVGPITAGAIASIVALGHPNPFGWQQLTYVAVVAVMYTVLRHSEDYFVIPLVIGRIVRLHPAVVIFSLLAGGALFGLLGVILAVPAAATIRLLLVYVAAKLRDEDPFPQLEREIEAEEHGSAKAAARAPEVSPTERAARPLGRP
jgi:predicted PurR-regulated permease PerM